MGTVVSAEFPFRGSSVVEGPLEVTVNEERFLKKERGEPIDVPLGVEELTDGRCLVCKGVYDIRVDVQAIAEMIHREFRPWDGLRSVFGYRLPSHELYYVVRVIWMDNPVVRQLVLYLKFRKILRLLLTKGQITKKHFRCLWPEVDSVSIHKTKFSRMFGRLSGFLDRMQRRE